MILKNDAVGDLIHSLKAINNITQSDANKKVTIFLSKLSQNFSFLVKKPRVDIKILNYNLSIIEKIRLIFFLAKKDIQNVYILSPKNFYYFLPLIFRKKNFYAICIDNLNNYKRPNLFLRKFLFKYEINDRGKIFRRDSTIKLQDNLTSSINKKKFTFDLKITKSEIQKRHFPANYIFFHYKKKIFTELNWKYTELEILLNELSTFCGNIILTKDVGNDDNNFLFKKNFNSYDFKKREYINNDKNILFLDNIVGMDLFSVIKYSKKVVAFHGMMTSIGFILNKPVLDLFHCKINTWNDYQRYRNSFYEFKPKYRGYDFIIPRKNINKTIKKLKFSLSDDR